MLSDCQKEMLNKDERDCVRYDGDIATYRYRCEITGLTVIHEDYKFKDASKEIEEKIVHACQMNCTHLKKPDEE